jgi:hypothetical protein
VPSTSADLAAGDDTARAHDGTAGADDDAASADDARAADDAVDDDVHDAAARDDDATAGPATPAPDESPSRAPDGPLDWLPPLPTSGAPGRPDSNVAGTRSPIFSPVVAPDDVPHPGDRQS